jgi:hypothetical protein
MWVEKQYHCSPKGTLKIEVEDLLRGGKLKVNTKLLARLDVNLILANYLNQ